MYFFTYQFFNPIKLILDYYLRQSSIPSFYQGTIKKINLVLINDCLTHLHQIFRTQLTIKLLHTHFNFKGNFSCLFRNHLQSNLLRRNLFNRSQGAISVNNSVIMFGFFNFVIALVVVFYTSNGQSLWKEQGNIESEKQYFQLPSLRNLAIEVRGTVLSFRLLFHTLAFELVYCGYSINERARQYSCTL